MDAQDSCNRSAQCAAARRLTAELPSGRTMRGDGSNGCGKRMLVIGR